MHFQTRSTIFQADESKKVIMETEEEMTVGLNSLYFVEATVLEMNSVIERPHVNCIEAAVVTNTVWIGMFWVA